MKGIMDEDYAHAKRLSKDFKIKKFGGLPWLVS